MFIKTVLLCALSLLIQHVSTQCIGAYGANDRIGYGRYGYDDFGYGAPFTAGYGPASLAASHGPGLAVTSTSPITPIGVSILSENGYEGGLAVCGAVPFLGTVGLEGVLPTAGTGGIAYNCGIGVVAITSEDAPAFGYAGIAEPFGYGYGFTGPFGYGTGFAEPFGYRYSLARPFGYRSGCGYGVFY